MDIGSLSFSDLVYADDTAIFVEDASNATDCLSSFDQSEFLSVRLPRFVGENKIAVRRFRFWT